MEEETYSTDGPECPYCGHQHQPSEDPAHYYNEGNDSSTCESCDKDFEMSIHVSHSWTCKPFDD
jgi:transposase-like protein